jgi:hypothetical protein
MPATRTWVSGVGDDANPGSRTAPCKTFAGAISKTAAGGEINVLDPGGFGAVTITKSITIDATGVFASVLASGTSGISINGAGINVVLRGLSIDGAGTGLSGVRIIAADKVHVEDCEIFGFTAGVARGIDDSRSAGGLLFVTNTTVRENGSGIVVRPAAGSTAIQAFIDHVRLVGNTADGLIAGSGSRVTISNSLIAWNLTHGLFAESPIATAELDAETCVVVANAQGIHANPGATIRISNQHVVGNTSGLSVTGGGVFATWGNNRVAGNGSGNTVPGSPAPIPLQ